MGGDGGWGGDEGVGKRKRGDEGEGVREKPIDKGVKGSSGLTRDER